MNAAFTSDRNELRGVLERGKQSAKAPAARARTPPGSGSRGTEREDDMSERMTVPVLPLRETVPEGRMDRQSMEFSRTVKPV